MISHLQNGIRDMLKRLCDALENLWRHQWQERSVMEVSMCKHHPFEFSIKPDPNFESVSVIGGCIDDD